MDKNQWSTIGSINLCDPLRYSLKSYLTGMFEEIVEDFTFDVTEDGDGTLLNEVPRSDNSTEYS